MDKRKEITRSDYQAIANLYIDDFETEHRHFDFIDDAIKLLETHKLTNKTLVDVGAGPGTVTDYLLKKKWPSIISVDYTAAFINYINDKYRKEDRVKVINQDIEDFVSVQQNNTVAGYIDSYALIHIPYENLEKLFLSIYSSTAPGGVFVMACWEGNFKGLVKEPYQTQKDSRLKIADQLQVYMNYFTKDEIVDLFRKAGYKIVRLEQFQTTPKAGEFENPILWILAEKPVT